MFQLTSYGASPPSLLTAAKKCRNTDPLTIPPNCAGVLLGYFAAWNAFIGSANCTFFPRGGATSIMASTVCKSIKIWGMNKDFIKVRLV
ncbi:hypothetical protein [Pseudomonas syringae]|uniref:hypothetical protein n=1 Tax=Pseudomonas syringae TaxID=317 RepID=UPI0011AF1E93|nr:hypothetical protein [Pseudomonas syringae]